MDMIQLRELMHMLHKGDMYDIRYLIEEKEIGMI